MLILFTKKWEVSNQQHSSILNSERRQFQISWSSAKNYFAPGNNICKKKEKIEDGKEREWKGIQAFNFS